MCSGDVCASIADNLSTIQRTIWVLAPCCIAIVFKSIYTRFFFFFLQTRGNSIERDFLDWKYISMCYRFLQIIIFFLIVLELMANSNNKTYIFRVFYYYTSMPYVTCPSFMKLSFVRIRYVSTRIYVLVHITTVACSSIYN